jgi:hypothetical protein
MELLRLQETNFPEVFEELDAVNHEIDTRRQQIVEAESLSRAMDRAAWTKFLVFSCGMILIVVSIFLMLLH